MSQFFPIGPYEILGNNLFQRITLQKMAFVYAGQPSNTYTPHSTSKAPAGLTLSPAYHTKKKRRFIVLNRAMTFHQWLRQISMKLPLLTPLFYWHKVILIVIELI